MYARVNNIRVIIAFVTMRLAHAVGRYAIPIEQKKHGQL